MLCSYISNLGFRPIRAIYVTIFDFTALNIFVLYNEQHTPNW